MFVNLLDLNDNDPTFQNLPSVAEVLEGTPAGVSVYQVSFPFLARAPGLSPSPPQPKSGQRIPWVPSLVLHTLQ